MLQKEYLNDSQWGQVVAKVHSDSSFKQAFELDPRQAVEDNKALFGIEDMTGISVLQIPEISGDTSNIQAVGGGKGISMGSIIFACAC
ncbi:MAG: hypothetical protein VSS75_016640 [Candidatus Parabeggiatoa sp.]|nr:hypothetical protein [Candidatus Parabeggiatoa sp.]